MKIAQIDFEKIKVEADPKAPFDINSQSLKIGDIISTALNYVFTIAGILLLIYLVISGFKMFTSGGDQKKAAEAKASLTNAAIGFVIVLVAFWIVQLSGIVFGLGTNTNFKDLFTIK